MEMLRWLFFLPAAAAGSCLAALAIAALDLTVSSVANSSIFVIPWIRILVGFLLAVCGVYFGFVVAPKGLSDKLILGIVAMVLLLLFRSTLNWGLSEVGSWKGYLQSWLGVSLAVIWFWTSSFAQHHLSSARDGVRWRSTVQRLIARFRRLPGLSDTSKKDHS